MIKRLVIGAAALVAAAGVGTLWFYLHTPAPPDVPFFATDQSPPPDLARVEHEQPLSRSQRMRITQGNLKGLTQEELDQVYGRLTAGPIPDGAYKGDLFFPKGEDGSSRLAEIVGGGLGRLASNFNVANLENIGRQLWRGKVFYRQQRVLRNQIENLDLLRPLLGADATEPETLTVPRPGLLGYVMPTTKVWLLFPSKLYCGQSLIDGRRESIIIDYAYSDDLPGYRRMPDFLAGREGFGVRDEIRMVRPGFYLGRAYLNRVFALNFTLYKQDVAESGAKGFESGGAIAEDCWVGEQRTAAAPPRP